MCRCFSQPRWVCLITAITGGLFAGCLLVLNRCPDLERCRQLISEDMTEDDIVRVLGCPPGVYVSRWGYVVNSHPVSSDAYSHEGLRLSSRICYKGWLTNTNSLLVVFIDKKASSIFLNNVQFRAYSIQDRRLWLWSKCSCGSAP